MQPEIASRYPFNVDGPDGELRFLRLSAENRDALHALACSLPQEDLLFLRSDVTDPKVVDRMVDDQSSDRRVTVLVEADGDLVGWGSLERQDLSWQRHWGEMRLVLGRGARGRGLSHHLAREIFEVAEELGLTRVVAQMTREQEAARRVFDKLGFNAEALLTDWVIDRQGKTHDLVIMAYDVTD
ncbi:MAG: GNAT family N-acetyltransferase [Acidobacteriota bacterium]